MHIFAGGMPRASYGDRHTVSVIQGEKHVVFDFSSKVVDFFVICDSDRRRRLSHSIGDVAGQFSQLHCMAMISFDKCMPLSFE